MGVIALAPAVLAVEKGPRAARGKEAAKDDFTMGVSTSIVLGAIAGYFFWRGNEQWRRLKILRAEGDFYSRWQAGARLHDPWTWEPAP
jgi:hypothetical protein